MGWGERRRLPWGETQAAAGGPDFSPMAASVLYFELLRHMKNAFDFHLRLVVFARRHGIKSTAQASRNTVPTVCKCPQRYRRLAAAGLIHCSRALHRQPRQTLTEVERHATRCDRNCRPSGPGVCFEDPRQRCADHRPETFSAMHQAAPCPRSIFQATYAFRSRDFLYCTTG